jgi:hypothetical protein
MDNLSNQSPTTRTFSLLSGGQVVIQGAGFSMVLDEQELEAILDAKRRQAETQAAPKPSPLSVLKGELYRGN